MTAPDVQLHIAAGPAAHDPGRRVLAVGTVRGGVVHTRARWGDYLTSGRRPARAADDALAAGLTRALAERHAAGPAARAGETAWQQRKGA